MSSMISGRMILSEAERRAIEEARKERERRLEEERKRKALREEIKQLTDGCLFDLTEYDRADLVADALMEIESENNGWEELRQEFSGCQRRLSALLSGIMDDDSSAKLQEIKTEAGKLAARSVALKREIDKLTVSNQEKLDNAVTTSIAAAVKKNILFSFQTEAEIRAEETKRIESECAQQNYSRLFALKEMDLSAELKEKVGSAVTALSDSHCDAKAFQSIVVAPLEKECAEYVKATETRKKKYEELIVKYQCLCEEAGLEPGHFTATEVSVGLLEKEIPALEEQCNAAQQNEYIETCVNEVMEELGYPVIGHREVEKKNGTRFVSDLYSFEDGSVVNVTVSKNGNVSMEIGGADSTGREPSEREAEELCPKMEHFCGRYSEIERRLMEKGVLSLDGLRTLPPTKEYAQVFDLNEYETIETAGEREPRKRKTSGAAGKAMRME